MKGKILLGAVAVLFGLFVSCGKDDPAIGEVKSNSLQVKIDGREKTFSNARGRWVEGGNSFEVTATDNGKEWLSFTVMSDATRVPAGEYSLDDASAFDMLVTYGFIQNEAQSNYAATRDTHAPEDAFSLKLEKIDNGYAEGVFSGVVVQVNGLTTVDLVTLTEGKFKVDIKAN